MSGEYEEQVKGEKMEDMEEKEEKLTLEKFEEATEAVSKVISETKLVYSEHFSNMTGNKVYFKPEICSIREPIRFGAPITKSARFRKRKKAEGSSLLPPVITHRESLMQRSWLAREP